MKTVKLFAGRAHYEKGKLTKLDFSDKAMEREYRRAVKEEAKKLIRPMQDFFGQFCQDAGFVTNHIKFKFAEKRNADWGEKYLEVLNHFADLILTDDEDDPDLVYSKAKIDSLVKEAVGEYFIPFDERYGRAQEWLSKF